MVLTRKTGDTISIGDNIKIHIQEIRGNSVKIAIEAPDDLAIHREDAYLLVEQQNRAAAQASLPQLNALAEKMLEKIMIKMKEKN